MTDRGMAALPTDDTGGRLLAVVGAPRGSANKLKFEPAEGVFFLHKVLPPGTVCPFDLPTTARLSTAPRRTVVQASNGRR